MKKKWVEFVESIRKDKKKGLVVVLVVFGLIGTLLAGILMGNGKKEEVKGEQISSLDIPVDTLSINNDDARSSSSSSNEGDDFFAGTTNTSEGVVEQDKNEKVQVQQTYYPPKKIHQSSGGGNEYATSSNKTTVTKEEVVNTSTTEKTKRSRVPSDGAGNMSGLGGKSYIGSVANGDKGVKAGSYVKIRLAEEMTVSGLKLPKNTVVTGIARVQQERMGIAITSVKVGTETRSVDWVVFDEDGNEGVAIPSNILNDIARDGSKEAIDKGGKSVEANVPIVGSIKLNLERKNQEISFVIRDGHRIYIKEKK
jgi:hypothetical protein